MSQEEKDWIRALEQELLAQEWHDLTDADMREAIEYLLRQAPHRIKGSSPSISGLKHLSDWLLHGTLFEMQNQFDTASSRAEQRMKFLRARAYFEEFLKSSSTNYREQDKVPRLAECLLNLFLTGRESEYIVGDLCEEYAIKVETMGMRKARRWIYKQVLTSIRPLVCKAVKSAIFYWVGAMFRRKI